MTFNIYKKTVTSFDRCSVQDYSEGAADGGVYVFDIEYVSDGSSFVTSSSDNCLTLYDAENFSHIRKFNAHTEMINSFDLSKSSPNLMFSASNDHCIRGWDLRVPGEDHILQIKLPDDATAVSVGILDTLLAAGCCSAISFYDMRRITDSPGSKKPEKLGEYSDIHTDTITQLRFSLANSQMLVSGAEDGLISLFNTSAADGDDAVVSILNTECPVRRIGFFGACDEALYCLSTTETASFWHCLSAQRVGDFQNIRDELGVDYLVDCMYDGTNDILSLVAGSYNGSGKIAVVEPTALSVIGDISEGGHSATIRCAKYSNSVGQNRRIITGGEDANICGWSIDAQIDTLSSENSGKQNTGSRNTAGEKSSKSSSLKSSISAAKKNDRRQKPY